MYNNYIIYIPFSSVLLAVYKRQPLSALKNQIDYSFYGINSPTIMAFQDFEENAYLRNKTRDMNRDKLSQLIQRSLTHI